VSVHCSVGFCLGVTPVHALSLTQCNPQTLHFTALSPSCVVNQVFFWLLTFKLIWKPWWIYEKNILEVLRYNSWEPERSWAQLDFRGNIHPYFLQGWGSRPGPVHGGEALDHQAKHPVPSQIFVLLWGLNPRSCECPANTLPLYYIHSHSLNIWVSYLAEQWLCTFKNWLLDGKDYQIL
jgi:hypothetical protein